MAILRSAVRDASPYRRFALYCLFGSLNRRTESSLITQRDALLDDTTQNIHDRAALLVAADPAKAAEYNLTPAALADLQSAITGYAAMLGTPRAAIATRVATTEAIAAEIDRAMDNLKRVLDRLIVQFESSHPAFTSAYHAARKIVDSGNSHAGAAAPPQA
jgi:hypothetical protein